MLRHSDDRVVDRAVAVRMVLTNDITDDPRALLVGPVPVIVEFVHRKQHATMNRLKSVPHIRQGPTDDYAHCVIQVRTTHLLLEADREGFFGEAIHVSEL